MQIKPCWNDEGGVRTWRTTRLVNVKTETTFAGQTGDGDLMNYRSSFAGQTGDGDLMTYRSCVVNASHQQ